MAKTTDVPHDLRPFNKLFSDLEHGWNYGQLFSDFTEFMVESFMPVRQGVYERLATKYGSLDKLMLLQRELILTQHRQIVGDQDWYDALGGYYEVLNSRGKSQWLGQFFTPAEVCTMMAMMQGADTKLRGAGKTVLDPCSGSGRLLLAWHALAPGNYQFGADIDPICARMTAINMVLHGCVGEAVCMDTLRLEWRFGYRINARLNQTGVPSIEPLLAEDSMIMRQWQKPEPPTPKPAPEPPKRSEPPVKLPKVGTHEQLLIF